MFENFAKLDSPRRLVQFWQNLQTSLVLLIPNCTRQRMITYTKPYYIKSYNSKIWLKKVVICEKCSLTNFLIIQLRAEVVTTFGSKMVAISTHNTKL